MRAPFGATCRPRCSGSGAISPADSSPGAWGRRGREGQRAGLLGRGGGQLGHRDGSGPPAGCDERVAGGAVVAGGARAVDHDVGRDVAQLARLGAPQLVCRQGLEGLVWANCWTGEKVVSWGDTLPRPCEGASSEDGSLRFIFSCSLLHLQVCSLLRCQERGRVALISVVVDFFAECVPPPFTH